MLCIRYSASWLSLVLQLWVIIQRWSRGHKARGFGQGHKKNPRPRPRTAFPRTDTLEAKDTKKIRGQGQPFRGQTLSRPRTEMLQAKDQGHKRKCSPKKKKKGLHKNFLGDLKKKNFFFKRSPQKNVFRKIFQALHEILTIQKIVLSSSRGQANFQGLEASRPNPRTLKCVLEDSNSGGSFCAFRTNTKIRRSANSAEYL